MSKKKAPLTSARRAVKRSTDYSERVNAIKDALQGEPLEELARFRRDADRDKDSAEDLGKDAGERIEGVNLVMGNRLESEGIEGFVDKLGNKFTRVVKVHASVKVANIAAFKEKFGVELAYLWVAGPNSNSLSSYVNALLEEGRNPDDLISVFEKQTIKRRKP